MPPDLTTEQRVEADSRVAEICKGRCEVYAPLQYYMASSLAAGAAVLMIHTEESVSGFSITAVRPDNDGKVRFF